MLVNASPMFYMLPSMLYNEIGVNGNWAWIHRHGISSTFFIFVSTIPTNKTMRLLISLWTRSCYAYVYYHIGICQRISCTKKQRRILSKTKSSRFNGNSLWNTPLDFAYLAVIKCTNKKLDRYTTSTWYFLSFAKHSLRQRHWRLNFYVWFFCVLIRTVVKCYQLHITYFYVETFCLEEWWRIFYSGTFIHAQMSHRIKIQYVPVWGIDNATTIIHWSPICSSHFRNPPPKKSTDVNVIFKWHV